MADAFPNRAAILSLQLKKLNALLAALVPSNGFYAAKLKGRISPISDLDDFRRNIPFTTKAEVVIDQQQVPPYGSNLTFPIDHYSRMNQTSGTAGAPLRWLDTPDTWQAMVENWTTVFLAAGVTAEDRIYFAFSFGPFLGFWLAFEAGQRIGALCLPGGGLSSSARLRAMVDNEATVLCCTPTYALRLAEVAAHEKLPIDKTRIRKLMVAGEPGGSVPSTRALLERLWPRASVFDHHGMTEVGPVTYECPAQPGVLHVMEEAFIAEVIDPGSENPSPPGRPGELVLTTLDRIGSPLLRYRTGDLVHPSAASPCTCGRFNLALEGGIIGRTDDMVVVRGVNIFPSAIDDVLHRFGEVVEYQVRVRNSAALADLEIAIESSLGETQLDNLIRSLERDLQNTFSLRIPVKAVASGSLPRFEMKARRWIRE